MNATDGLEASDDLEGPRNALSPREMLEYAIRAAKRHFRLCASVMMVTVVIAFVASKVVPVTYEVKSRILVDETFNKTEALSTPDRALPNLDPLSGSFELVMQKSSLLSIVDEANLVADEAARQSGISRAKNRLMFWLTGFEQTLDSKREALVKTLLLMMNLKRDGNVVTVNVNWSNPSKALQICQIAHRKLLELVQKRDTATFSTAISILDDEAKRASEAIESALADVVRARDENRKAGLEVPVSTETSRAGSTAESVATRTATALTAGSTAAVTNDHAASEVRNFSAKLAQINGKIQAVEDSWHRQQAALNAKLAELRTVYGQAHPQVIQQEALIATSREPPAELGELQQSRSALLEEIQNTPGEESTTKRALGAPRVSRSILGSNVRSGAQALDRSGAQALDNMGALESPLVTTERAKLTRAIDRYNALSGRLASARLQLMASQATLGMRFVVIGKPEYPRAPAKPIRTIVRMAGLALGLIFGLAAGALRELLSGVIHDPVQIKSYGLKSLGELRLLEP